MQSLACETRGTARYEANPDFQSGYCIQAIKAIAGRSPGNDDEVSVICFPHKLNIVLEGL